MRNRGASTAADTGPRNTTHRETATEVNLIAQKKAALTADAALSQYVIYADNSLEFRDSVQINGGDVGVRGTGSGTFLVSGHRAAIATNALVDTAIIKLITAKRTRAGPCHT